MIELSTSQTMARPREGATKFLVGGALLLAAVAYLIINGINSGSQYYTTVRELTVHQSDLVGRRVRISGAVIGESIQYDGNTLRFDIVHIPDSTAEIAAQGGLTEVLHTAVSDPGVERVTVVLVGEPKPDLLKDEAQAIVTGRLGEDGIFYANELLLKCPTRYEETVPDQVGE